MRSNIDDLISKIEKETGFSVYEYTGGSQLVFYGTSDKFEEFKEMIENKVDTGTIAVCMDTGNSYMYSLYKNEWYNA